MEKNIEKKQRSLRDFFLQIINQMDRSKHLAFIALFLAALGTVLMIIGPRQIGRITNLMQEGLYGEIDIHAIGRIGTGLIIIYVLSWIFLYGEHFIMASVTLELSRKLREHLCQKINRVPQSLFNFIQQGDILSRITNDVSVLQQALSNSLPTFISAATQFLGCLIIMFFTEWRLACCSFVITLIAMLMMTAIILRSQKYFRDRQECLGTMNAYVEEIYSGHAVVRLSNAEDHVNAVFHADNQLVYDANWKSQFFSGIMQPIMHITGNICFVAICIVGSYLVISGKTTIGTVVSFLLYVRLFTNPLNQIAQSVTNLQSAIAGGNRILDFLQEKELEDEREKTGEIRDVKGQVTFDHIQFSYPDDPDQLIIKDFSAQVLPGQKVAIVGPTGAGKTTIVNLLMRFFEITGGTIRIDGQSTFDMKRETVHSLFSMVLQDTWLFEGSVRSNLIYNKEGISDEKIYAACHACGIDFFIRSLPQGLDTILDETVSLSAGQKQLMTIARAMIQNHPMMILDEATSSVDTRTELITQKAMDTLTTKRTSFVIAHRLSTIKNADMIFVLDHGDIMECGTHEELLAKHGFYSALYQSQFEKCASASDGLFPGTVQD